MVERALQIAKGCIEDMQPKGAQGFEDNLMPENFLASIFYFRVCSYTEQVAMMNHLEKFVLEHQDVGSPPTPKLLVTMLLASTFLLLSSLTACYSFAFSLHCLHNKRFF